MLVTAPKKKKNERTCLVKFVMFYKRKKKPSYQKKKEKVSKVNVNWQIVKIFVIPGTDCV